MHPARRTVTAHATRLNNHVVFSRSITVVSELHDVPDPSAPSRKDVERPIMVEAWVDHPRCVPSSHRPLYPVQQTWQLDALWHHVYPFLSHGTIDSARRGRTQACAPTTCAPSSRSACQGSNACLRRHTASYHAFCVYVNDRVAVDTTRWETCSRVVLDRHRSYASLSDLDGDVLIAALIRDDNDDVAWETGPGLLTGIDGTYHPASDRISALLHASP